MAEELTGKLEKLTFECVTKPSGKVCVVDDRAKHMKPGDVLVMLAMNIPVDIKFIDKSPFRSGIRAFHIAPIDCRAEVVGPATGEFKYTYSCGAGCPSETIVDTPPEMIVP